MIMFASPRLRSMPIYQAQLTRTAFRSFAPAAGVYDGAPRPPRPPPCPPPPPAPAPRPPWAGAVAGAAPPACPKTEAGSLTVRPPPIAILVPKIFRRTVMMIPFLFSRSRYRRKFGSRVHPECVPTVVEGWQQQPVHSTAPSLAIAELEVTAQDC